MPSQKILEQKKEVVQELVEKLKKASSGILVDYRGLTVEQDTELRNQLRKAGVEYKVVKNTLTRFAAKETGYEGLDPFLHGPTSLALTYEDPVAAAKVLTEFAKKNEKLEIKVGFVDGKVIDINGIKALADLPPREVLIAKVLGGFNAPISGFVNVLNANLRGLAVALNAIAEKKAAEGQA
ncbi:MAG: large subunit ribosomal protein [Petroclostridium sp.]|jgi:large subunit ribosomal protein L10|uniref:50S ribosomal protein L10 n=1 Tax=Petroclostridium xylanilyticum TaxID=1792311 RepID=UPI000B98F677|nr:50S ribosomal protein L10 [Petroclostridium xylanilyticum]MBZ4646694.1 ribosomal protein [Clostridia bacterium]MDK2811224.1 large subunit ribosomal protein [Petroclostridium sp.]